MRYLASHFRWTAGVLVGVLALLPARAELGLPNRVLITDDGRGPIRWSPDGTKIAFQSKRDDGFWVFYVADANGTNVRKSTLGETLRWSFNFSPDGTQLLLYDVDSDNDNDIDIYVQDVRHRPKKSDPKPRLLCCDLVARRNQNRLRIHPRRQR